jgi:hypothetical protein
MSLPVRSILKLNAEITGKISKNMIIPLGIRDVDTNKNHRDECDNSDSNNVSSSLKYSL